MQIIDCFDNPYLTTQAFHEVVYVGLDWAMHERYGTKAYLTGHDVSLEMGDIEFKHDSPLGLSNTSTVTFYLVWDYHADPEDEALFYDDEWGYYCKEATLNMEEYYYYMEMHNYIAYYYGKRTKEEFFRILDELAKFRKTCEIKDIYSDRLKPVREAYGVTI